MALALRMPRLAQVDRRAPWARPQAMTSMTAGPGDRDSATSVSTYSQYVSQLTALSNGRVPGSTGVGRRGRKHPGGKVLQRGEDLVRPLCHQRVPTAFDLHDSGIGTGADQGLRRTRRR